MLTRLSSMLSAYHLGQNCNSTHLLFWSRLDRPQNRETILKGIQLLNVNP